MILKPAIILTLLLLSPSFSWAGDIAGNGGQIVVCSAPLAGEISYQPEAGIYSLDYIQFRDSYQYYEPVSLDDSFDRIEEMLELLPKAQASFKEYRRLIKNTSYAQGKRIWTLSSLELIEIRDTATLRKLPVNCRHQEANDAYGAFQIIVRRVAGDAVFYEAYSPYLDKIEEMPLQASFLYVHEWLWDFAKDAYQSRRANVLLHGIDATPEEVAALFVGLKLSDAGSLNQHREPIKSQAKGIIFRDLNTALFKVQYVVPANIATGEAGQVHLALCPDALTPDQVHPNCSNKKIEKNICLRRFIHNIRTKLAPSYRNRNEFLSSVLESMTTGSSVQRNDSLFEQLSSSGYMPNETVVKTTYTATGTCKKMGGEWLEIIYGEYSGQSQRYDPHWTKGYPIELAVRVIEAIGLTSDAATSALRDKCPAIFPPSLVEKSRSISRSGQERYVYYDNTISSLENVSIDVSQATVENPVSCEE